MNSNNLKLLTLTIQNFLSYGNNVTTINLDFNSVILIKGMNYDSIVDGQIDSNGAGKSAILDALAFVLYDKTISKKDKNELIHNINKKNMEVTLTFEKKGKVYKIVRSRKTKSKGNVELYIQKDGEFESTVDKALSSIKHTNAEIERIVGLPFDVFSRILVFSALYKSFLDMELKDQISILEELFGYKELSEKADRLRQQIKDTKGEFKHLEELSQQIKREKERHAGQVESTKARITEWAESNQEKIKNTEERLDELKAIPFDDETEKFNKLQEMQNLTHGIKSDLSLKEKDIENILKSMKDTENKINRLKEINEKIEKIEENVDFDKEKEIIEFVEKQSSVVSTKEQELNDVRRNIADITRNLNNEQKNLDELQSEQCPYCKQAFSSEEMISTVTDNIAGMAKDIEQFENKEHAISKAIDSANNEIGNKVSESKVNASRQTLDKITQQYSNLKSEKELIEKDNENEKEASTELDALEDSRTKLKLALADNYDAIEKIKETLVFSSPAELERVRSEFLSQKEKLEELKNSINPHSAVLEELHEMEFDDDKVEKLNELDETITHQEFLLRLLTKKDSFLRKKLLDKSLPFLNTRIMVYLKMIGMPHKVEFLSDMSPNISQFGNPLSFSGLSSGQKARVNLALAFAFRDVLQARHGKIDFCMLDECLDVGLGNVGVQLAAKMIKEIAEKEKMSMFVISHRDEIAAMFKNKMVVEYRNGFSNIVEDTA